MPTDRTRIIIAPSALPEGAVLAAVSGGADSIAMLRLLCEARGAHENAAPPRVLAAHFNHGIRGAESDADEEFVRAQARELGVPFFSACGSVPTVARETGESLEMAARRLRHAFFQKTAFENGCVAIATGHTADDQIETLFLRFARGASLRGICGMTSGAADVSASGRGAKIPIIRPLLAFRHEQLCEHLRERGIPWREDSSNASAAHQRNRVRGVLVPAFESALGASAVASALRTMERLREDAQYLDEFARAAVSAAYVADPAAIGGRWLLNSGLASLPRPIFNRAAADWLYALPINPELITQKTLDRFHAFVTAPPRGRKCMSVAAGWRIVRAGGRLFAEPEPPRRRLENGE